MNLTRGSILNMTTDRGTAHFQANDGESFTLPLIGWAVYVRWSADEPDTLDAGLTEHTHETDLEPVVLVDGDPQMVNGFLRDLEGGRLTQIELA